MRRCIIPALLILLGLAAAASGVETRDLLGNWYGGIEVPGGALRIALHISQAADGTLSATMDSLDQGAMGMKLDTVTFQDGVLDLELKLVGGSYHGLISPDGKKIDGTWNQSGMSVPLVVERVNRVPEPKRPQVPAKPYPYHDEDVTFQNAAAGVTLAGTLTFPTSGGPFPAVVLITGSGPEDRDETVFGHKPFLVLADFITRRGIAVLRYDDRGVGGSTAGSAEATSEDFAGDALAAVAYLKTRKEIAPRRIGLLGHSEGGLIAPLAATRSTDVAFIVCLAGPGVTGEEIVLLQQELTSRALGVPDDQIAQHKKETARAFAIVKKEKDPAVARKRLEELLLSEIDSLPDEQKQMIQAGVQAQIREITSPWFRFFLTYDPRPALTQLKVPALFLNGEKDLQVPPKQNLPEIEKALKAGGNARVTVRELPGLNHLFQTAKTGSPSEYTEIEETMSPAAMQPIADWILEQTKAM